MNPFERFFHRRRKEPEDTLEPLFKSWQNGSHLNGSEAAMALGRFYFLMVRALDPNVFKEMEEMLLEDRLKVVISESIIDSNKHEVPLGFDVHIARQDTKIWPPIVYHTFLVNATFFNADDLSLSLRERPRTREFFGHFIDAVNASKERGFELGKVTGLSYADIKAKPTISPGSSAWAAY